MTKKMSVNKYSKAIDKIIASKKPIVEQFMDLMGLMDVTFIDENQTSNGRLHQLTKTDSSKKQDKSDCCGAKVLVTSAIPDEGTRYWKCSECGKPCNIMSQGGSQTKRKRDATTGSTVKAHLNWRDKYLDKFHTTPHKGIEEFITELLSTQRQEILEEILDLVDKLHMPVGRRELEEEIKSLKQK